MSWGTDAFARAQAEKKPIYVALGSFTSELSRAMARQSFANVETGKFLNENFVCVLVDAKERADIAALYQNYLQAVKQVSGPPMNLWLTPDLKPFEGANYLPPTEEWGKEGFVTISKRVAAAWSADPQAQARKADEAIAAVSAAAVHPPAAEVTPTQLAAIVSEAMDVWKARFDAANGGFGEAPKYAEPELLRAMLRTPETREMAVQTLRALIHSPVRDPLDGGFFRYSADAAWRQPYFQKLLIDQPRLALALLDAAKVTGDAAFGEAARSALRYVLDQLALAGGDFVAAEDATGEDLTPSYLWAYAELQQVLGEKDAAAFAVAHGATEAGNLAEDAMPGIEVKGKNVLFRATPPGSAAEEAALVASAVKLRKARAQRPAPRRDDTAISGAHGLLLTALARAGAELNDRALTAAAKSSATFIQKRLRAKDGLLLRLDGRPFEASAGDYALVIDGLLTYHETSKDSAAAQTARDLLKTLTTRNWDQSQGRFFAVPATGPEFWARVTSPAATSGEPPTAEPAALLALLTHPTIGASVPEVKPALVRTLAADAKVAAETVRGDVLLALRLAADSSK